MIRIIFYLCISKINDIREKNDMMLKYDISKKYDMKWAVLEIPIRIGNSNTYHFFLCIKFSHHIIFFRIKNLISNKK